MPGNDTPYDKLSKANDDYHEAVDAVLCDKQLDVSLKADFTYNVKRAFDYMAVAAEIIKAHYTQ